MTIMSARSVCVTFQTENIYTKPNFFLGLSDIYNWDYHVTIPYTGVECASMLENTFSNCCFLYVFKGPNSLLNFLFV